MKSKEFITEAEVDQAIAQANQPGKGSLLSRAAKAAYNFTAGGLEYGIARGPRSPYGTLPTRGAGTAAQGQQAAAQGQPAGPGQSAVATENDIVKALGFAARGQAVNPTGNKGIDDLLKKARLLAPGAVQENQNQPTKPRNFVAKNAPKSGAGAHTDRKRASKQGYEKHKKNPGQDPTTESRAHKVLDTWFKNRELQDKFARGELSIPSAQERAQERKQSTDKKPQDKK